jgi:hypothetical protein
MKPTHTTPTPQKTISLPTESMSGQEQIRRRAYELYEQRGREDGHELSDWVQAESEVTQQITKTVAA